MSISDNIDFLRRLPKMADFSGSTHASRLQEVDDFGANPGNLTMWCYVPQDLPPNSPLVVVLHGCTQTAAGFDHGSGWSALAARYGFALLYPEQRPSNNPNLCFNWFDPNKTARGSGEALSIHRMIAAMVRLHRVSASRIYITGLSAGGALVSSMLAAYPEVFAGGAIIAGLPHGVATNLRDALSAMALGSRQSPKQLGDLVREASSHEGRWPKVSVWHGTADRTVHPANADQIVTQWLDVQGLPTVPTFDGTQAGHHKLVWRSDDGAKVVESNTIDDVAHGVPLEIADVSDPVGAVAPFMLEAGISSTRQIADFFDLTSSPSSHATPNDDEVPARQQTETLKPQIDLANLIARALSAFRLK